MDDATALDWITLQHLPNVGPVIARQLLNIFPQPRDLLQANAEQLAKIGLPDSLIEVITHYCDYRPRAEEDWLWLQQQGAFIITCMDEEYPALLKEIYDAPVLLYGLGDRTLLQRPQIAMVGSRRPTRSGSQTAIQFARELSSAGLTITSGLALGIDGAAHSGALEGRGSTIAVLGTGLDVVYPRRHQRLYQQIVEQGVVISEAPLGTQPRPEVFPRRNRIISGLSLGVMVVEAAVGSGSLITARSALEQNREVFALPGSHHNPLARGCHALIREGATLVEEVADIMAQLEGWSAPLAPVEVAQVELSERERSVLTALEYETLDMDQLVDNSRLSIAELIGALTSLELKDLVENRAGLYSRVTP